MTSRSTSASDFLCFPDRGIKRGWKTQPVPSVRVCLPHGKDAHKSESRERLTLSNETHFNNEKKRRATHTYTGAQSLCVCVIHVFGSKSFFFRRWVKQTQKSSKDRAVAAFKGIEEETSSSSSCKRKEKSGKNGFE
jgi:hypothetical protein